MKPRRRFGKRFRNSTSAVLLAVAWLLPAFAADAPPALEDARSARDTVAQQLSKAQRAVAKATAERDAIQARLDELYAAQPQSQQKRIRLLTEIHAENRQALTNLNSRLELLREQQQKARDAATRHRLERVRLQQEIDALRETAARADDANSVAAALASFEKLNATFADTIAAVERAELAAMEHYTERTVTEQRIANLEAQQAAIAKTCEPFLVQLSALRDADLAIARQKAQETMLTSLHPRYRDHVARLEEAARVSRELLASRTREQEDVLATVNRQVKEKEETERRIAEAAARKRAEAARLARAEAERLAREAEERARVEAEARAVREAKLAKIRTEKARHDAVRREEEVQNTVTQLNQRLSHEEQAIADAQQRLATARAENNQDRIRATLGDLVQAKNRHHESQAEFRDALAELESVRSAAAEARTVFAQRRLATLQRADESNWEVGVGAGYRVFDDVTFATQEFRNYGTQAQGTFVTDNSVPTASATVQAALGNGPYGVQNFARANVDAAYTNAYSRSRFEDQEFFDNDAQLNVTVAADYVRFDRRSDSVDSSSGAAPLLSLQRRVYRNDHWTLNLRGQVQYNDISLDQGHAGDMASPGSFTAEQYRHALVDVDDNTAVGFQDFLLVINPYDPNRPSLNGYPLENNTTFRMRNEFQADVFTVDLGINASYRRRKLAANIGVGPTVTFADASARQRWSADWQQYTSSTPNTGLYPSAPFNIPAGRYEDSRKDSNSDVLWGGYLSLGAQYYLTPFFSLGTDVRYDAVSGSLQTEFAEMDLSSFVLQLRMSYKF